MKYDKVYILIILLAQTFGIAAQSEITGRIIDKDSTPMASVTVLVLSHQDSTYITGTMSDLDGRFKISNLKPDNYILSFSMIGFKKNDISLAIENYDTKIILEDYILDEDIHALSEVVIIGRQDAIELEAGETITNMGSTIFGVKGSLFDALKTMPGIFVKEDGTITLNGQAGITIMFNGRPTFMSGDNLVNILKSIPSASVDRIELTTSPPSKYDASGKAGLINIRLRLNPFIGISGSLNTNYKYSKHGKEFVGGRFSFQTDKLSISTDYSHYQGTSQNKLTIFREYIQKKNQSQINQTIAQNNFTKYRDKNDFFSLNIDYIITKKITVGYHSYGILNSRSMPSENRAIFSLHGQNKDSTLYTTGISLIKQRTLSGGMYAEYKNDKKTEADFSADYLYYDHKEHMTMNSRQINDRELLIKEDTLKGNLNGRIGIYSLQNNYVIPISTQFILRLGLKSTLVSIDNSALYYNGVKSNKNPDIASSNKNSYSENINATYAQMEASAGRFSFHLGLRIENTRTKSIYSQIDLSQKDSSYQNNYINLFPTIVGIYNFPDENHTISIIYNKRITRPNYRDLMPFNQIWDKYTISQGNPNLKAELTHNIEAVHIYKNTYRTTFFIFKTKNAFSPNYLVREGSTIVVFPDNITSMLGYGFKFDTGHFLNLMWWKPSLNASISRANSYWRELNNSKKADLFTYNVSLNNQFYFGGNWSAEISAFYNGRMIIAQTSTNPFGSVSAGIMKKIFDNRASIRFFVEDIFSSSHNNLHINYINIRSRTTSINDSRCFGFSFSYNFKHGKQNSKNSKERIIDESKRINL